MSRYSIIVIFVAIMSVIASSNCGKPNVGTSDAATTASASPSPTSSATSDTSSSNPNATFTYIKQNIIDSKCLSCHSGQGGRPHYSTYTTTKNTSPVSVVATSATSSSMYNQVAAGSMPQGGPALSTAEKQAIYDWIQNGAANN